MNEIRFICSLTHGDRPYEAEKTSVSEDDSDLAQNSLFYKSNTSTPVIDFKSKKGKKDYPHVKQMLLEHLGGSIIP